MSKKKTHTDWGYLTNQFYIQTKHSYKNFFDLSTDHLASLEQAIKDNQVMEQLARDYQPLHEAFSEGYAKWKVERGKLAGATFEVEQMNEALMQQIGRWDVQLQNVYYSDTKEYKSLLPNKRRPFQAGPRAQRMQALKAFVKHLAEYPVLKDLHKEVNDFYQQFLLLKTQQQRQDTEFDRTAERLQELHHAAAGQMYRNLGMLIYLFETSYEITAFFKLSLVRRKKAKTKDNGEITEEFVDTFDPDTEIEPEE